MYHYVRPDSDDLRHFRNLHVDDFYQQIEWFTEQHAFVSRENFLRARRANSTPPNGILLTFDDGLRDHYDYAFKELRRRNLWAVFFVPTAPYQTGKLLDVHRVHLLLGHLGGETALELLKNLIDDSMLSHNHIEEYRSETYRKHDEDGATKQFKRILNYFISYDLREGILDQLTDRVFGVNAETVEQFYLTPDQIVEMHEAGMVIGSHGAHHKVLSKLSFAEQKEEIESSFSFLETLIGEPVNYFCYPYGGPYTFTSQTERLLEENGSVLSFAVEPRDVTLNDLRERPQALPRFDCNMFPFGRSRTNII